MEAGLKQRVEVPDAVVGGRGLSRGMRATLRAFAEVLFADDAGPPPAERLSWTLDELDDFLCRAGFRARLVLRLGLWCLAFLAPLWAARPPLLRWWSFSTRRRALERFEGSPLGITLFGVKAILCTVYYEHPDMARFIGYDGECQLEQPG